MAAVSAVMPVVNFWLLRPQKIRFKTNILRESESRVAAAAAAATAAATAMVAGSVGIIEEGRWDARVHDVGRVDSGG